MKERVGEWAALQPPAPTGGFADCEAKFLFQGFRPSPPPPPPLAWLRQMAFPEPQSQETETS